MSKVEELFRHSGAHRSGRLLHVVTDLVSSRHYLGLASHPTSVYAAHPPRSNKGTRLPMPQVFHAPEALVGEKEVYIVTKDGHEREFTLPCRSRGPSRSVHTQGRPTSSTVTKRRSTCIM